MLQSFGDMELTEAQPMTAADLSSLQLTVSVDNSSSSVEAQRPTQHIIGHFGNNFYRSYDQTNSVKALKETSWSFK